jgi:6-phosphogluconolactonase
MKILCALLLLSQMASAAIHRFYIGTRSDRDSKGIYMADFDDSNGALSNLRLAAPYLNPGFLCACPKRKLLYSIGNRQDGTGTLAAFSIGKNHALTFIGDVPSGGKGPCHLALDPECRMISVANYGGGTTASFLLDKKGMPSEAVSVIQHVGNSVHPERQTAPHAHGVYFSGESLFVPDLGLDRTLVYQFDSATAVLKAAEPPFAAALPGDGPRHLAFHPKQPWVYAVNELSNTVTHYVRNGHRLLYRQSISTLPADFTGTNTTAEIEVHPDGRFLYASNRGHQSIAAFAIHQETGGLIELGQTIIDGKTPRHFAIAPGGAFLIVAGQDSDNLQSFAIDPQSGKLSKTEHSLAVPSPICLLFVK